MALTADELNRATLARQLLLERADVGAVAAARQVFALQGQEPASPYLALWNRAAGFDAGELDRTFASTALVKATLMRTTLHVVTAEDYPLLHRAMQPTLRGSRLGDRRFTSTGVSREQVAELLPLLADQHGPAGEPRSAAQLQAWLGERLGLPAEGVWWALRSFAPLRHAVTGGPWSFGQRPAYLASGAPPGPADREAADEALPHLVRRYLSAFGPATVADIAQFALVQRARVRTALARMGEELERLEAAPGAAAAARADLLDVPDAPRPPGDIPAPPRLLGMWDSVLLAYADRSRLVPPDYRPSVIRTNGDVLPTLLVDGRVAGVWRTLGDRIEASAFHRLPEEVWGGLAAEAASLLALLAERDPRPYRRYDRWWDRLPDGEVRLLP